MGPDQKSSRRIAKNGGLLSDGAKRGSRIMSNYKELLIGAGSSHVKRLSVNDRTEWADLITLDINGDHLPDVMWNLESMTLSFADKAVNPSRVTSPAVSAL